MFVVGKFMPPSTSPNRLWHDVKSIDQRDLLMIDDQSKQSINAYLKEQSKRFNFLVDPDAYLLGASITSGFFSIPFLVLNIMALDCVLNNCPDLYNGSNTASGWILFESITLAFILITYVTGSAYFRAKRQKES